MKQILFLGLTFMSLVGFGQNNVFPLPSGNVGIGTTSPQAKLHVYAQDNSVASILSETSYNNNRLQIRNYVTTQVNQPVFRLQHTFYGSVENNGFIDFLRGESSDGGFLALGTNGTEKLRINTIGMWVLEQQRLPENSTSLVIVVLAFQMPLKMVYSPFRWMERHQNSIATLA